MDPAAPERFECLDAWVAGPAEADLLGALAWESGAVGLEEHDDGDGDGRIRLRLYARAGDGAALRRALEAGGLAVRLGPLAGVAPVDWSEAWKQGLEAIEVSPRLRIRPSFVGPGAPGPRELVIDPGRAFGTGSHASTRLALEWIDAERDGLAPGSRVLDVGTGTGVLALAALALGAGWALGLDLDPLAAPEARAAARANRLAPRLALFTGPIAAVSGTRFDRVVANLLRSEMLPIAEALAAALAPGGRLVLSGLLASDREEVEAAFAGRGLRRAGLRSLQDANGDEWIALLMVPAPDGPGLR